MINEERENGKCKDTDSINPNGIVGSPPFFKKSEARILSGFVGMLAVALEYFILFVADDLSGGAGRALVIIPIGALILIRSILKNSR